MQTICEYAKLSERQKNRICQQLLSWYEQFYRPLPWRKTKNPYFIWISEVMAQQTKIIVCIEYYLRFIHHFPTIEDLAKAPYEEVLKNWEGLGYYSRAKNMHETAKIISKQYHNEFPKDYHQLLTLPGIGHYTAAAIASICFNLPYPAVDGNVLRVCSRLFLNKLEVDQEKTKNLLRSFLTDMISHKEPGNFNQALMELGALICIPQNPKCTECPLFLECLAKKSNCQCELPIKKKKNKTPSIKKTMFIIFTDRGYVLMRKRTERLLHGLMEFFMVDGAMNEKELFTMFPNAKNYFKLHSHTHVFTHMKWEIDAYLIRLETEENFEKYLWYDWKKLFTLPMGQAFASYREILKKCFHSM